MSCCMRWRQKLYVRGSDETLPQAALAGVRDFACAGPADPRAAGALAVNTHNPEGLR